ncbi:HAT3 [Auxenochlorella protothecoides x Auxenochlorella symbiontica]
MVDAEDPQPPSEAEVAGTPPKAEVKEEEDAGKPAPAAPPAAPVLDTYTNRELKHLERERSGEVQAHYVINDGSPLSGRLLIGLKNVFSKCLPNMPKEYITRLVFDRRHRSVVITRNNTSIIAGITYRPFHSQRFAEIAFCAVAQSLQVSGFGTRLMSWTKLHARDQDGCQYFLTYADNNAVGYFSKQGFSKTISMEKERWHGFIKDYDGGTLMECHIHPTLPFTDFAGMVLHHKAALEAQVRKYTKGHVQYPGLEFWRSGPAVLPISDIPGVRESGWTEASAAAGSRGFQLVVDGARLEPTPEALHKCMTFLVKRIKAEPDSWPFLTPVSKEEVPDYYDVIKDPIDLTTIQERLASRAFYQTLDIFAADVLRMFNNAKIYNAADTIFHKIAVRLSNDFQRWVVGSVVWTD